MEELGFDHEIEDVGIGITLNHDPHDERMTVQLAARRMSCQYMSCTELAHRAHGVDHEGHRKGRKSEAMPPADRGATATGWPTAYAA